MLIRALFSIVFVAMFAFCGQISADESADSRPLDARVQELESSNKQMSIQISRLQQSVNDTESRQESIAGAGIIAGTICALWAQFTGRSAWLWFFLGLIFSVLALLALLYKNAYEPRPTKT